MSSIRDRVFEGDPGERVGPAVGSTVLLCGSSRSLGFAYLFIPLITIVVFTFNDPTAASSTRRGTRFTWDNWATRSQSASTPTPSS